MKYAFLSVAGVVSAAMLSPLLIAIIDGIAFAATGSILMTAPWTFERFFVAAMLLAAWFVLMALLAIVFHEYRVAELLFGSETEDER